MRLFYSSKGLTLTGLALLIFALSLFSSAQTTAALTDEAKEGVLSLMVYGPNKDLLARGAGFYISEGVVATAYHLVSQADMIEGINVKGKKIKADGILSVDRKLDVALLRLKGKPKIMPFGNSDELASGKKILSIGPNEAGEIIVSDGTVRAMLKLSATENFADATLAVPDAFNGAPVLNEAGQIVGLVLVLEKRGRFIIPANAWRNLPQPAKPTEFKAWTKEDYMGLLDGSLLAGRLFAAADDLGGAQKYLEKAVQTNPAQVDTQALLASVYVKQRDYQAAVNAYKKLAELDPQRADAYFGMGDVLYRTKQLKDAAAALEKGLSLNPQNTEALFNLGSSYEELKDFAKAAEAYQKYVALNPQGVANGYLRLGLCRQELNQMPEAVQALEEAVKAQPQDLRTQEYLAQAYYRAKQLDKAEEAYLKLAQLSPESAKFYYSTIVRMYDEAQNYDKAIEASKRMIDLNPKDDMAVYNLGIMYFRLKRFDEAIDAFKQTLAIKPDNEYAWFNIGSSYTNQKKFKESVEPYKKYLELVPESDSGWLSLGVSYMQMKNHEAALEPMRKAVELKPDNGVALYNLAIIYLNLKDDFTARETYKKLVQVDPTLAEKLKKLLR